MSELAGKRAIVTGSSSGIGAATARALEAAGAGVVGCLVLAASLPAASVVAGAAVLAAGVAVWVVRSVRAQPL